jgi:hydrogenase expression/formation protein HypC
MCLTAPGHVLAVEPDFAVVEVGGRRRRASILLEPEVRVGDWVIIAGGAVMSRIDRGRAMAMDAAYDMATRPGHGDPGASLTDSSPAASTRRRRAGHHQEDLP